MEFLSPGHHPPTLITTGVDTRQIATSHMHQSLLKAFQVLAMLTLPHRFPVETTIKAFKHVFFPSPLPSDWPWCFPVWPCVASKPPVSRELWVSNKLPSFIISVSASYHTWLKHILKILLSVQLSSVAQSCPTLRDPMNCSTPGLPVHQQLPEFTQTHVPWVGDAIQPSHALSSPFPPAPNPSQQESLLQWVNSSHPALCMNKN